MPGPGRPSPAVATDPASREQVLVAALGDESPEVHVASLDPSLGVLTLREATVRGDGQLSLGQEKNVPLHGCRVEAGNTMVLVIGPAGQDQVQLHFEEEADQRTWAEGLRVAIEGADHAAADAPASAAAEDTDEETHMLQARSRQLQTRIGALEAVSERRDRQLHKMMRRLDGAMQMLTAVQDMCDQQRKVIEAQKVAASALRQDCGEEAAAEEEDAAAGASARDGGDEEEDEEEEQEEDEDDDFEAKGEQMIALLQQAEQMQKAIDALESKREALEAEAASGPARPAAALAPRSATAPAAQASPGRPASAPRAATSPTAQVAGAPVAVQSEEDTEAVLARLRSLESEKARYETMLQDSQQEHDDLLQRLDDMRSLMSMLGLKDDGADDNEDNEDDDGDDAANVS